jgi:hypothetical protein
VSRDDYDDRQRDSDDYLHRRQERLDFEEMLARRHDAVYEAIRKKEHLPTASVLGGVPSDSSGVNLDDLPAFEARNKPQTVYEQWLKHKTRFIIKLESSDFLPANVIQQWIRKIKQLDIFKPSRGLEEIDALYAEYTFVVDQYKPQRDVFDKVETKTIVFKNEMHDLMHELDWLKAILKHVEI